MVRFECPHCGGLCEVLRADIRCGVFRHAAHADTMTPFDPHASRDRLANSKIWGCGLPFRMDSLGQVSSCGYI